ncbi:MAG: alpha/beta hydrolase [Acidimicrobiia bacterium]
MRRLGPFLVVVACCLAALVPVADAGVRSSAASGGQSSLTWEPCEGDAECALLPVPLDDTVQDGPTIDIALVRYLARDPDRRIGALLVNPGGPGASGVDFAGAIASSLSDEIQERFDIVGFDPRGIGRSAEVDCTEDLDPFFDVEWAPDNRQEREDLLAEVARLVAACERSEGAVLPYLQTERVARDMDRIRRALGEPKLTYLGYSYGTLLGAWYAEQFPDRVRALVLDGPIDPALDGLAFQVEQSVSFERNLDAFLDDCSQRRTCAFHHNERSERVYDQLRAKVGAEPLVVQQGEEERSLNGTRFDLAVTQLLYDGRAEWDSLAFALERAARGDGSELLFYADFYTGREGGGQYENTQEQFIAIGCADGPPVGGVDGMRAIEDAAAEAAPRLGRSIVNGSLPCALWPVMPAPPRQLRAGGAAPILVIGATRDPATPFPWAKALARQLESGVLLSVDGGRHTSFDAGNRCVDRVVEQYLVRLDVPDKGTSC